jgi:hypothetical protein
VSASDHLSKNQFRLFHGTNAKIEGNDIEPTHQTDEVWEGDGPHAAFASDRPDIAAEYGKHVYEVKPTGHEENYADNVYGSEDGFQIKRKLKPEVVERYKSIVGPIHEANYRRENYANQVQHRYNSDGSEWKIHHDENGNKTHEVMIKPPKEK